MRLSFAGQLRSSPFAGKLFPSDIRPRPLVTEDDFVAYALFARKTWAPVLMSFPQKCSFLAAVYNHVLETIGPDIDRVVMNCRVPGVRMPVELGQDKVFQVVELQPEVDRLVWAGESFLAVYEGFVRHPLEQGNNELLVEWHNHRCDHAQAKFGELSNRLRLMGLADYK